MASITYIVGMHRSGTSALSRLMHMLGNEIPGELDTNTFHNASGHWEPVAFVGVNTRLLHAWGSDWCELRLPELHAHVPVPVAVAPLLDTYLTNACQPSGRYVLKDPRVCYTLTHWLAASQRHGHRANVVIPVRHPLEVAQSLAARDAMPLDAAIALWLCHMLSAEWYARGTPRCAVYYDALIHDWRSAYAPIAQLTGTTLPVDGSTLAQSVAAAIVKNQRHHVVDAAAAETERTPLLALALDVYHCFGEPLGDAATQTAFDQLRMRARDLIQDDGLLAIAHDFAYAYRLSRAIAERETIITELHAEIAANHRAAQSFIDAREDEYRAQYADLERKLTEQLLEANVNATQAAEWFTSQLAAGESERAWLTQVQAAQTAELEHLRAIITEQAPYVRILRALHFWRRR